MPQYLCHLLDRPETIRTVTADRELEAPDEYAQQFITMAIDDVAFIWAACAEVPRYPAGLWRVACVLGGPGSMFAGYVTRRCTEDEARVELSSNG